MSLGPNSSLVDRPLPKLSIASVHSHPSSLPRPPKHTADDTKSAVSSSVAIEMGDTSAPTSGLLGLGTTASIMAGLGAFCVQVTLLSAKNSSSPCELSSE